MKELIKHRDYTEVSFLKKDKRFRCHEWFVSCDWKTWGLICTFLLLGTVLIAQGQSEKIKFELANSRQVEFSSLDDWSRYKESTLIGMEEVMGALPERTSLPDLDMVIIDSLRTQTYIKYHINFAATYEERVTANLYIPLYTGSGGKLPGIVALHPTGIKGKDIVDGQGPYPNRAYGKELAERGYVVIAPDYPSFGELADHDFTTDRYESGTMAGIFYHMRSVDLLEQLEFVDAERIGVIGHSLGGHNAIFLGAFDERLKAVVSSCGWTLLPLYDIEVKIGKHFGGRYGCWAQDRYMPLLRDKYKLNLEDFPFDFDQAIFAIAPRPFFSSSPIHDDDFYVKGVEEGMKNIQRLYQWMGVPDHVEVHYPDSGHDFPTPYRRRAYEFLDYHLAHTPRSHYIE
ncbi:MAG TPA: alpha/beta fold hydrolase [Membranihabitans sp.]|nr:alpha/beta fold hydrolase [Membranihabitans sp.]